MNKVAIVALGFCLVAILDSLNLDYTRHYLVASVVSFLMFKLCFLSSDKIIRLYGVVNLFILALHINLMIPSSFYILEFITYDATINVYNTMLTLEITMIVSGIYDEVKGLIESVKQATKRYDTWQT